MVIIIDENSRSMIISYHEIDELNKEIKKTESDIKEAQANLDKAEKKLAELTRKA